MRYLMFVCTEPSAEPYNPDEDNIEAWVAENDAKGTRVMGDRLADPNQAVTIRRRKGRVVRTDGPFVETKECIVGIDLLECASLEEALEVAAGHPMARFGMIEVRPFWQGD